MVRLRVDLSETWGEGFANNIERALDCGFIFSKYKGFFSLQKFEVRKGSPGRSDGRRSLLPWPSFGPLIYRSWRYGRSMIRQSTKLYVDCRLPQTMDRLDVRHAPLASGLPACNFRLLYVPTEQSWVSRQHSRREKARSKGMRQYPSQ